MRLSFAVLLLLGGCLGEATVSSHDLSANVVDLSAPHPAGDGGAGDGGALYNCLQLNDCEQKCAGDPKPTMCVAACRAKATATAVTEELALQGCFNQYCPQSTDAGTAAVCTQTDMGFSQACSACILNSQVASNKPCTPAAAPECHQCYSQADTCRSDP